MDVMEVDGDWSEVVVTQPRPRLQGATKATCSSPPDAPGRYQLTAADLGSPTTAPFQFDADLTSNNKVDGWLDDIREDPKVATPLFNMTKQRTASKCFAPSPFFPLNKDCVEEAMKDIFSPMQSLIQKVCAASGIDWASPARFRVNPPQSLDRMYTTIIGHQKIGARKAKVMQSVPTLVFTLALTGAFFHDNVFNGDKFPSY